MTDEREMTEEERALLLELEAEEASKNEEAEAVEEPVEAVMLESPPVTLFQTGTKTIAATPARPVLAAGEVRGGVHVRLPGETVITKGISLR